MADELQYFVGFTLLIIVLSFMINISIDKTSTAEGLTGTSIFDYSKSPMKNYDLGNYTLDEEVLSKLPNSQVSTNVNEDQGGFFSDVFGTIVDWIKSIPGVNMIIGLVNALPNFLKMIFVGDLYPLAFAFGYLWNILFILAIAMWLKG